MDSYKELSNLLNVATKRREITILQGIVKNVSGATCSVDIGGVVVSDVRLRASIEQNDNEFLITPQIGSAVILASLDKDYNHLVVVAIDRAEQIVINGGKLGGLIKIEELTKKLNELINAFNNHTHTAPSGATTPPLKTAKTFSKSDYEDTKIKH